MRTDLDNAQEAYATVQEPIPSREERRALGKKLRKRVSRSKLGIWKPADDRADPVESIIASHRGRAGYLVGVRVARMVASPYGFLRGAANVCADDCAALPATGIMPVICGDAHLGNFGFYRSPEGELVIDLNDFDEAHPGCWEWDLRRLTASVWVAGRENSLSEQQCADAVHACANAYRDELEHLSNTPLLARTFMRVDMARLTESVSEPTLRDEVERAEKKARRRTSDRALPKLTDLNEDGNRYIVDDPPLTMRLSAERQEQVAYALDDYLQTLPSQWRRVLAGYYLVDVAHKVVGVGSVGLRAFVALLVGSSPEDYLFLQLKEARRSVLAKHIHGRRAWHLHQGQRVVEYQQTLQTVSDPLLGWATLPPLDVPPLHNPLPGDASLDDAPQVQLYIRQYRNMKGAVVIDGLDADALIDYSRVLGMLLAKSHARTRGASSIVGYIGASDAVADAFVDFARAYADQTEADHALLVKAVRDGRLPCDT